MKKNLNKNLEIDRDLTLDGNTKSSRVKSQQPLQLKQWFFTFNGYLESDILLMEERFKEICFKYVFQEEIGENGNKHLQGNIWLLKKMRWSEFKLSPKIHWEKTRNEEAAEKYCQKDATRSGRVFVYPKPIKVIDVKDMYDYQKDILNIVEKDPDDRLVYWFYESTGNKGKSSICKYLISKMNALFIDEGKKADLINLVFNNNMDRCRIIVIDIPRANGNKCSYKTIEAIKNGMICNTKYETGTKLFNPPHILIFSNYPPEIDELSKDRWQIYEIREDKTLEFKPVDWKPAKDLLYSC